MKTTTYILGSLIAYLVLCVATYLMLHMAIEYSSFKTDIHFLQFKQDYIGIPMWRAAFYTHVFSSVLALAAGLTQFSGHVLKNHRRLHRVVGWIYTVDILIINFPAALIMAYYANGLLPSKIAFTILDCLWFWFTYKAVIAARNRKIDEHKRFMIRSYALTFSAITLRSWKIILAGTLHPDPLTLYMIDAWMGFVPNLLLAEWLIWIRKKRNLLPLKTYIINQQQNYCPQDHNKTSDRGYSAKDISIRVPSLYQAFMYYVGNGIRCPTNKEKKENKH